ncbi:MAG: 2-oxoglutarate dehydrogenase E1 component, partial [Gammaproteobacteria bacterium]|nr:2-oxoglutarate dehydrogenase E1 component [Gammaproteobacteria bacterium]
MYQVIKAMPVPAKVYADRLIQEGILTEAEWLQVQHAYKAALDDGKSVINLTKKQGLINEWARFQKQDWRVNYTTTLDKKMLLSLAETLDQIPASVSVQAQVDKALKDRAKMTAGLLPVNWGYAEILAYASLVQKGSAVRLTGEDVGRGTFSHRHAILHDQKTGECTIPLQHLSDQQAAFTIYNSLLSEEAVLAFEYGYASTTPDGLTIWEAQFGDFVNGAQVIIDQFMSAAEEKWGRLCGLTLLLPHGQEGMGPEHSSARLERFLQLCAHDNMQVCNPTTPAQIYHLLRRQVLRPYRKPLVIMSPKSLLRHPLVTSTLDDLADGHFMPVIGEIDVMDLKTVRRVIFCQGKVYYDLLIKRREKKISDIVIIRLEQMYPFPDLEIKAVLKDLTAVKEWVWCQEEPENQGAWFKVSQDFAALGLPCRYVGRKAYASPAVGYASVFKEEQDALVSEALA